MFGQAPVEDHVAMGPSDASSRGFTGGFLEALTAARRAAVSKKLCEGSKGTAEGSDASEFDTCCSEHLESACVYVSNFTHRGPRDQAHLQHDRGPEEGAGGRRGEEGVLPRRA